MAANKKT